jgi:hypothetical protein
VSWTCEQAAQQKVSFSTYQCAGKSDGTALGTSNQEGYARALGVMQIAEEFLKRHGAR